MDFIASDAEASEVGSGFVSSPDEASEVPGAWEAAGRGALRNLPLAQQATAALEPGEYGENLQNLTTKAEAAKAAHPVAYGAGAVAGTAAPLLLGQPEGIAANVALGAGLNTAQSLSDTPLNKPLSGDALKQALVAAGLGGALGGAGAKFFPGKGAGIAPKVEEAAAPEAAQAIEAAPKPGISFPNPKPNLTDIGGRAIPNKPVAPDFVPTAERTAASAFYQGLGGTPRQQMKLWTGKDPIAVATELRQWMDHSGAGQKSLVEYADRPGELLQKIEQVHDDAGKTIGRIVDSVSQGNIPISGEALTDKLAQSMQDSGAVYDQKAEHAINTLINQVKKAGGFKAGEEGAAGTWGPLSFDALQRIKGSFGKLAKSSAHDATGASIKQAYGELSGYMNDIVDQYGQMVKDPGQLAKYTAAKYDYKNASNLLPILRYQEAKELIGGPAGHFSLRGLLGTLVGTVTATPVQMTRNALLKNATNIGKAVNVAAPIAKGAGTLGRRLPQPAALELGNFLQNKYKENRP